MTPAPEAPTTNRPEPVPLPAGLGTTAYRTRRTFGPADAVAPLHAPNSPVKVADLLP